MTAARRIDFSRARLRDLDIAGIQEDAAASLCHMASELLAAGYAHIGPVRLRVEWQKAVGAWCYSFEIWCYRSHELIPPCADASSLQPRVRGQIGRLMASLGLGRAA